MLTMTIDLKSTSFDPHRFSILNASLPWIKHGTHMLVMDLYTSDEFLKPLNGIDIVWITKKTRGVLLIPKMTRANDH